jgi:hypothetical protein
MCKKGSFTSTFSTRMYFIYFSCLIALARSSSTMLMRGSESGQLSPAPDLRGKAVSLPFLSGIFMDISYHVEEVPFIS